MPQIQISIRTLVVTLVLLVLAVAAPFLAAFLPQSTPQAAAADPAAPAVQELVLDRPRPTPTKAASTRTLLERAVRAELEQLQGRDAAAPLSTETVRVRVATNGPNLNLRAAPGLEAPVLGGVPNGQEVTAVARDAESAWLRVTWNGLEGWLFAGLTQVVQGDPNALPVVTR